MGLVNSHLQRKREVLIHQVDTINQSIEFLEKLEARKTKDIKELEQNKTQIMNGIERMDTIVKQRKKEYIKTKDVMECSICMENKVNCVLIPCGHMYCSGCIMTDGICPHCREPFDKVQRLYFV
jgi:hypothetical protein